ncbi:glycosyltransferase [Ligilactobacillus acidipiscis]|uniref:glycosyltransferase n=1 Tax=Ligilactobacillus acidipiscis TaxID=89059 RepID=UPI0022E183C5|nr:glycosyltransferase [Ligilactobacillus acidipiscis]
MRILVVIPPLSGKGGTETVLKKWMKHFSDSSNNLDVNFIAPQGIKNDQRQFLEFSDLIVGNLQYNSKNIFMSRVVGMLKIMSALWRGNYDKVICLTSHQIKLIVFLRKILRKKFLVISWIHSSLLEEPTINIRDVDKADEHLAISTGIKREILNFNRNAKVEVLFNPVGVELGKERIAEPKNKQPIFVYIGRLQWRKQKNLEELFLAFSRLRSKNWRLLVVGTGTKEDLTKIKDFVKNHNIEDNVNLLGWQKQPFLLLREKGVTSLVMSSNYEGLSMVLLEAQSYGIPIVASNVPTGNSDIVKEKTGFLYEPGNIDELVELLGKLIDNPAFFDRKDIQENVNRFSENRYFYRTDKILRK